MHTYGFFSCSEKLGLHKSIEKLTLEVQEVRERQEELRAAKQVSSAIHPALHFLSILYKKMF